MTLLAHIVGWGFDGVDTGGGLREVMEPIPLLTYDGLMPICRIVPRVAMSPMSSSTSVSGCAMNPHHHDMDVVTTAVDAPRSGHKACMRRCRQAS